MFVLIGTLIKKLKFLSYSRNICIKKSSNILPLRLIINYLLIIRKNEISRKLGERPNAMEIIELDEAMLQGQVEIWRFLYSFTDFMGLTSAVELRIADIIHSNGGAATLSQIPSCISDGLTSPDITALARIMRLLVRRKIFTIHPPSDGGDPLYNLTHSSRWLLHDSEQTLAPLVLLENHPWQMAPWHYFSQCVKEGGVAFKKAHGCEMWDLASRDPDFNKLFNDGMACTSKFITSAILSGYKQGFKSIG
ncbi:hypothetical protein Gotur_003385 [Gossypium turneri]